MKVKGINKGKAKPLIEKLKKDYLMSQRDIAKWCGVMHCVVNAWANDKVVANDEHLDKLREALVLLAGRNVKYPHQALDILQGRE
jgi:hypothetical protein